MNVGPWHNNVVFSKENPSERIKIRYKWFDNVNILYLGSNYLVDCEGLFRSPSELECKIDEVEIESAPSVKWDELDEDTRSNIKHAFGLFVELKKRVYNHQ